MPTPSDTDGKLLRNPRVNRGSAFSSTERRRRPAAAGLALP